ncbi:hypothetical protein HDE_04797 [Halotydeus destructor]|nr:hypothetical protein HDE_04797 [Halotydeus destructor]
MAARQALAHRPSKEGTEQCQGNGHCIIVAGPMGEDVEHEGDHDADAENPEEPTVLAPGSQEADSGEDEHQGQAHPCDDFLLIGGAIYGGHPEGVQSYRHQVKGQYYEQGPLGYYEDNAANHLGICCPSRVNWQNGDANGNFILLYSFTTGLLLYYDTG